MANAQAMLEQYFLEMRWRCLSLAADLDRIERADGGSLLLENDPRAQRIRQGLKLILETRGNRAERFQDLFSDHTPPPAR